MQDCLDLVESIFSFFCGLHLSISQGDLFWNIKLWWSIELNIIFSMVVIVQGIIQNTGGRLGALNSEVQLWLESSVMLE